MKDELHHKLGLYKKLLGKFTEEELTKRLGLKDWELDYIRRKTELCFKVQKRP